MTDTLASANALMESGFTNQQAQALVTVMTDNLATKEDIEALRLALEGDIEALRIATKADMEHLKKDLTIRLGFMLFAGLGAMTAIFSAVVGLIVSA